MTQIKAEQKRTRRRLRNQKNRANGGFKYRWPHKHEVGEPCYACFQEYVDYHGGLPTSPMDWPPENA